MSNFLNNFTMSDHKNSTINVYDKDCIGCQSTKADVMLSFGPDCSPTNGNNEPLIKETGVIDIFINNQQALDLYHRLGKILNKK